MFIKKSRQKAVFSHFLRSKNSFRGIFFDQNVITRCKLLKNLPRTIPPLFIYKLCISANFLGRRSQSNLAKLLIFLPGVRFSDSNVRQNFRFVSEYTLKHSPGLDASNHVSFNAFCQNL